MLITKLLNTALEDSAIPIPKFAATGISGVTFGGFLCDKYINSQPNATTSQGSPDVAHSGAAGSVMSKSKKGVPVWDYITYPQAMIACANRGKGWHLISAFEWASMALLAKELSGGNTVSWPGGGNKNVNPPCDAITTTETATLDSHLNSESGSLYRALPGTGHINWAHNHMRNGVWDLNGLVNEWNMGLFLGVSGTYGHPEVLASLDVTYLGSPYGRGTISGSGGAAPILTVDGAGVNWLKNWSADAFNGMYVYIAEAASGAGAWYSITDTTATTLVLANGANPGNGAATFVICKHVATSVIGVTNFQKILTLRDADASLKPFAIPATVDATGAAAYGNDYYAYPFSGSPLVAALRGGYFYYEGLAGVFYLILNYAPSNSNYTIGFRACKAL